MRNRIIHSSGFLIVAQALFSLAFLSEAGASELTKDLRCTSFEWDPWTGVSERGSIRIPVSLNGHKYAFQLDTGSDATLLYGAEAQERGWAAPEEGQPHAPDLSDLKHFRAKQFSAGGMSLGAFLVWIYPDLHPKQGDDAGTLGLDALVGHVTIIDYRSRRFCIMSRADVPEALFAKVKWTEAVIRNGKLFVNVRIDNVRLDGIFFDTGSSAFSLSVDFDTWQELTGLADSSASKSEMKGTSWGKPVKWIGAPATGALVIGSTSLNKPLIYFREDRPAFFKGWPYPASGLIGSAPFWDDAVVLDLGAHPRFGVLR